MYKVIIIEDDPMVASINKQYVELTSSFHVEATFKNGILALQYLQNCTVDLIILDYYTPQMNGDEFIDQLHAAGMTPAIIMVTSANDAETVRRLISRGVTDYLVKPFEYDRFKAALERFAKRQEELKTSASASDLGQAEIDRLFSVPDVSSQSAPLTKGLNERTPWTDPPLPLRTSGGGLVQRTDFGTGSFVPYYSPAVLKLLSRNQRTGQHDRLPDRWTPFY